VGCSLGGRESGQSRGRTKLQAVSWEVFSFSRKREWVGALQDEGGTLVLRRAAARRQWGLCWES
jgi:hypothetical protein